MSGFFPPNYYGATTTTSGTYQVQSGNYTNYFTSVPVGDYLIEFDATREALVIKNANNKECISIQNNTIFLDGKSIYEVIFEVVQMIVGKQSLTAWLTDENIHKRAFAEELYKAHNKV